MQILRCDGRHLKIRRQSNNGKKKRQDLVMPKRCTECTLRLVIAGCVLRSANGARSAPLGPVGARGRKNGGEGRPPLHASCRAGNHRLPALCGRLPCQPGITPKISWEKPLRVMQRLFSCDRHQNLSSTIHRSYCDIGDTFFFFIHKHQPFAIFYS